MNATHQIVLLHTSSECKTVFRHQGVLYYPDLTLRTMTDVLHKACTYSIIDFGVPTPDTFREFLACDLRIVVCHASIWKSNSVDRFVQQLHKINLSRKAVAITSFCGNRKDLERLIHKYHFPVYQEPFLKNPFHINSDNFIFFEQLLKGESLSHY